jgi:hypothetical protein
MSRLAAARSALAKMTDEDAELVALIDNELDQVAKGRLGREKGREARRRLAR